jgi:hypothetical protein
VGGVPLMEDETDFDDLHHPIGKRCTAVSCNRRRGESHQEGYRDFWWDYYGTCSGACATNYYGEDVIDQEVWDDARAYIEARFPRQPKPLTVTLFRGWCDGYAHADGSRAKHPPHIWDWIDGPYRYCSGDPDKEI